MSQKTLDFYTYSPTSIVILKRSAVAPSRMFAQNDRLYQALVAIRPKWAERDAVGCEVRYGVKQCHSCPFWVDRIPWNSSGLCVRIWKF